jgi:DNA-binding XRE family transcriptional regulator
VVRQRKEFMKLQNKVRLFRERYGWPQAKLSSLAEVDRSLISIIEHHNYQPSDRIKRKIAAALGVTVAEVWPEVEGGNYEYGR